MKVHNVHERAVTAAPGQVAALFGDMEQLWPTPDFPAPKPEGDALRMWMMLWQPVEREGSPRAYDVVEPDGLRASHWFEVVDGPGSGSIMRHTIEGEAVGEFEPVWRERVEPLHDVYIEAMFDRVQEALA